MCLAIYKPAAVEVDWDALEEGFRCNNHGAGFAVVKDGELVIDKGHFTFGDFREAYAPYAHLQSAIHFRLATHGERNTANCHPFLVTPELSLIHNGILPIKCDHDEKMSDTWHYAELILKPLAERDRGFYSVPELRFLGEAAISGSKFVFLRADGDWCIWNDDDGLWEGDTWYSNRSHHRTLIGFSRPSHSVYSVDRSASACVFSRSDDEPDYADLFDPALSYKYDDLSYRDRSIYERLLEEGWEVEMLDDVISEEGINGLYDLASDLTKE